MVMESAFDQASPCLNMSLFFSLEDARQKLEQWRGDYDQARPHSSLNDQAPQAYAAAWPRSTSQEASLLEVLS